MGHSNFEYIYTVIAVIVGILLTASPSTFMKGAKYDEESVKTENLVKKIGIGLIVLGIIYGLYLFFLRK